MWGNFHPVAHHALYRHHRVITHHGTNAQHHSIMFRFLLELAWFKNKKFLKEFCVEYFKRVDTLPQPPISAQECVEEAQEELGTVGDLPAVEVE